MDTIQKTFKSSFMTHQGVVSRGCLIEYRPNSSDLNALTEVIEKHSYRRVKMGFEVKAGERWLDLGGNIGAFAIYCFLRGATCVSFEPEPDCFEILKWNMGVLGDGFACHNFAITDKVEPELQFFRGKGERDFYRFTTEKTRYVHKTLKNAHASILSEYGPFDGIKMDIEGSEFGLIDNDLIPPCEKLVIEYHLSRDPNLLNFYSRRDKLKQKFKTLSYPDSLDRGYPNNVYPGFFDRLIFCMGRKA